MMREPGPRKLRITSNQSEKTGKYLHRNFCPFSLIGNYIAARGATYLTDDKEFFIFRDCTPVSAAMVMELLKRMITAVGLDANNYNTQSLRIGRTTDLIKYGYTIEEVRQMGHQQCTNT